MSFYLEVLAIGQSLCTYTGLLRKRPQGSTLEEIHWPLPSLGYPWVVIFDESNVNDADGPCCLH